MTSTFPLSVEISRVNNITLPQFFVSTNEVDTGGERRGGLDSIFEFTRPAKITVECGLLSARQMKTLADFYDSLDGKRYNFYIPWQQLGLPQPLYEALRDTIGASLWVFDSDLVFTTKVANRSIGAYSTEFTLSSVIDYLEYSGLRSVPLSIADIVNTNPNTTTNKFGRRSFTVEAVATTSVKINISSSIRNFRWEQVSGALVDISDNFSPNITVTSLGDGFLNRGRDTNLTLRLYLYGSTDVYFDFVLATAPYSIGEPLYSGMGLAFVGDGSVAPSSKLYAAEFLPIAPYDQASLVYPQPVVPTLTYYLCTPLLNRITTTDDRRIILGDYPNPDVTYKHPYSLAVPSNTNDVIYTNLIVEEQIGNSWESYFNIYLPVDNLKPVVWLALNKFYRVVSVYKLKDGRTGTQTSYAFYNNATCCSTVVNCDNLVANVWSNSDAGSTYLTIYGNRQEFLDDNTNTFIFNSSSNTYVGVYDVVIYKNREDLITPADSISSGSNTGSFLIIYNKDGNIIG